MSSFITDDDDDGITEPIEFRSGTDRYRGVIPITTYFAVPIPYFARDSRGHRLTTGEMLYNVVGGGNDADVPRFIIFGHADPGSYGVGGAQLPRDDTVIDIDRALDGHTYFVLHVSKENAQRLRDRMSASARFARRQPWLDAIRRTDYAIEHVELGGGRRRGGYRW